MDHAKKNTLLLVDDDTFSLMMLSHILQAEYKIRIATSGPSTLRIAEKYLPDLIILDILMPDMNGYQLFTTLKNSEKTAHIPIIFISGLDSHHDEKKGLQMGAVDYISKPFNDIVVSLRVRQQIRIVNQLRTLVELVAMNPPPIQSEPGGEPGGPRP